MAAPTSVFAGLAQEVGAQTGRDANHADLTALLNQLKAVLTTRPSSVTTGPFSLGAVGAIADGVTDLTGMASLSLQVTGTFVGTVVYETSIDGVTWNTVTLMATTATTSSGGGSDNAPVIRYGNLPGRYFRARMSAWTSGAATVTIIYSAEVATFDTLGATAVLASSTADIGNVRATTVSATGSLAALNATVDGTTDLASHQSVAVQITGTWAGSVTFQVSVDGTNWSNKSLTNAANTIGSGFATVTTANGIFSGSIGARYFRAQMTAFTSGSATVTIRYNAAPYVSPITQAGLRSSASADGLTPANVDAIALGAFNGTSIDRLLTVAGAVAGTSLGRTLAVGAGSYAWSSVATASAPTVGTALDGNLARAAHTLQVDVTTTTAGTAGTHAIALQGSLDGANWTTLATLSPASTSTTATDASNHAAASVTGQPWRYVRASWTAIPTGWVGTLTARVASA